MSPSRSTTPAKKEGPQKLEEFEEPKVLEILNYSLQSDNLAPGGFIILEGDSALDRRHLPFPNWRCNECHREFETAELRNHHEAGHWRTSGEVGIGMSFSGHQALLNMIQESSRQLVLEEFINSPRRFKHGGLPPAPEIYRVPYPGTAEASSLRPSER